MAQLLEINATSRATGTAADCTFQLDRPLGGSYKLMGCQVPFMQPPEVSHGVGVSEQHVNRLSAYHYGGVLGTFGFLYGDVYTPQDVATQLATFLNASHGNIFTVTLDSTNHLVLSRTGTVTFQFYSATSTAAPVGPYNSLADTLGISTDVTLSGVSGTSLTFPAPVNLARPLAYHVNINNDSQIETTTGHRSTFTIPITVNSFELQSYKPNEHPRQVVTFRSNTRTLDVTWTNNLGHKLTHHANWSLLLEKV